jgi:hypothetical protein
MLRRQMHGDRAQVPNLRGFRRAGAGPIAVIDRPRLRI